MNEAKHHWGDVALVAKEDAADKTQADGETCL
jgi:hypothetical protein